MLYNQSLALLMLMMSGGVKKKYQMTTFTMTNNISSIKYTLKLVPGFADVWVPHGVPRAPPRCLGVWKKFK